MNLGFRLANYYGTFSKYALEVQLFAAALLKEIYILDLS